MPPTHLELNFDQPTLEEEDAWKALESRGMNSHKRLEAILDVVRDYLPPDGISRREAMTKIIGLVDPMPEESQKPVAYRWQTHDKYTYSETDYEELSGEPLYTAPQKREWVSLSHEDFVNEWSKTKGDIGFRLIRFACDIEAKLKEKNT